MLFSSDPQLHHATSKKSDGNMSFLHGDAGEVLQNRTRFLANHGVDLENCVFLRTPHEDDIAIAGLNMRGSGTHSNDNAVLSEALITRQRDVYLCLMTADCFPVAYFDPIQKVAALAHLGWRPAMKRLASKVVANMSGEWGSKPHDILVSIGPGIGKDSYTMTDCPLKALPAWQPFLEERADTTRIDLLRFILHELTDAGISSANIETSKDDTFTSPDYFSHRASMSNNAPEARFLTVLGILMEE